MKRLSFIFVVIIGLLSLTRLVRAYEYPIPELGNCRDQKECHLYCEIPKNHAACWSYSVYGVQQVLGDETPEAAAANLGLTFPIAELGNCTTVSACKAYCTITQNQAACRAYGQAHGLTQKERLVERATEELGCTTKEECTTFCQEETNRDACEAFARRYHLKIAVKNRLVEAAKTELGCTTAQECRALCSLPENQSKCAAFAQRMGVVNSKREELVERAKEQLGCTSFESCRAFCQEGVNQEKCRNFGAAVGQGVKNTLQQNLGCTTAEECKAVCEASPEKCPNYPQKLQKIEKTRQYLQQKLNLTPQEILERKPGASFTPGTPELVSPPLYPLNQPAQITPEL